MQADTVPVVKSGILGAKAQRVPALMALTVDVGLTGLETLSNEDLVRFTLPSVRFTHDLIGDWARFRA